MVSFLDKNRAELKMFTPSNGKMVSASPRERGIDFFDFDVYKVELWDPRIIYGLLYFYVLKVFLKNFKNFYFFISN